MHTIDSETIRILNNFQNARKENMMKIRKVFSLEISTLQLRIFLKKELK